MTRKRVNEQVATYEPNLLTWRTRTVEGVKLRRHPVEGWLGEVDGEEWHFYSSASRKNWKAYTTDHLTGGGNHVSLRAIIRWVLLHRGEWKAKLKVRRQAKTRMVDPVIKGKRRCPVCGGFRDVGTHVRCDTTGYEGLG